MDCWNPTSNMAPRPIHRCRSVRSQQCVVSGLVGVYGLAVETNDAAQPQLEICTSVSSVPESGVKFGVSFNIGTQSASFYSEGKFDKLCFRNRAGRYQYKY